ncbi:MAG: hypothetical protein J5729_04975 [Bacteroidaceae bacterium]|nr:hypothetical protein [Bacteroidaceae bacterium]
MKRKVFAIMALILLVAGVAASCTHHTCPAYRGSTVMVEADGVHQA